MSITINKIKSRDELYRHYSGQTNAQSCYIELDCASGTLSAAYNAVIGNAVPLSVYHGHDQRFGIPCLLPNAANDLMEQIEPLVQRVVDGYESRWDGNNNVAKFNDDATGALSEIAELCDVISYSSDENNTLQEWDAGDWLDGVICYRDENDKQCKWDNLLSIKFACNYDDIDHTTTDDQLEDLIEKIKSECDNENIVLNNLEKTIYDLRNQCKENFNF